MRKNRELAKRLRHTAYLLWEQAGCPGGQAMDYWVKAKTVHQSENGAGRWSEQKSVAVAKSR